MALADTGSELTLAGFEVLLKMHPRPKLEPVGLRLLAANGTPLTVVGRATLPIQLGSHTSLHTFLITKGIGERVVIGYDYMVKNGIIVDAAQRKITFSRQNVPRTAAATNVTLAPRSERLVLADCIGVDGYLPTSVWLVQSWG